MAEAIETAGVPLRLLHRAKAPVLMRSGCGSTIREREHLSGVAASQIPLRRSVKVQLVTLMVEASGPDTRRPGKFGGQIQESSIDHFGIRRVLGAAIVKEFAKLGYDERQIRLAQVVAEVLNHFRQA